LAVWKDWGLDEILKQAWETGVVLAGPSAGAICWFQQGITDSYMNELQPLDCLGSCGGAVVRTTIANPIAGRHSTACFRKTASVMVSPSTSTVQCTSRVNTVTTSSPLDGAREPIVCVF
ncbi:MAG: Type 1 glutamine amidotransferase-like domain-containing protein, partial [Acidobacteria bacterium]|nr:Type 1 glutamine amidotransferase-like domain-containing protein [Acidobacteriota bacterium]